jgi:hypothetical protein
VLGAYRLCTESEVGRVVGYWRSCGCQEHVVHASAQACCSLLAFILGRTLSASTSHVAISQHSPFAPLPWHTSARESWKEGERMNGRRSSSTA